MKSTPKVKKCCEKCYIELTFKEAFVRNNCKNASCPCHRPAEKVEKHCERCIQRGCYKGECECHPPTTPPDGGKCICSSFYTCKPCREKGKKWHDDIPAQGEKELNKLIDKGAEKGFLHSSGCVDCKYPNCSAQSEKKEELSDCCGKPVIETHYGTENGESRYFCGGLNGCGNWCNVKVKSDALTIEESKLTLEERENIFNHGYYEGFTAATDKAKKIEKSKCCMECVKINNDHLRTRQCIWISCPCHSSTSNKKLNL